uniref:Arrestin_C domain-containing protein n=1 Tax=Caenorhabditis tropicalis TaxID=1561998 RepID=A0A1I7TA05_9PELO
MLWVSKDESNKMPAGTHRYPFEFDIPANCPPSLNTLGAKNKYKIEVEIDRPWKLNIKKEEQFLVSNKIEIPVGKQPKKSIRFAKLFKSGRIFNEGPVSLQVFLPSLYCMPGETIDVKVHLKNDSADTINYICMDFGKECHCHLRHQHHTCDNYAWNKCPLNSSDRTYGYKYIGKKTRLEINLGPYSEKIYTIPFTIPKSLTTPSFSTGLITFGYFLQVGFKVKGSMMADTMYFTIIVGELKKIEEKSESAEQEEAPPSYKSLEL